MSSKPYLTLIADDSEDEQLIIQHCLSRVPNVSLIGSVQDGAEAVSYLRGEGPFGDRERFPYPDLLLLDCQMPRLNGMEVLALLDAEGIRPRIIVWSNALELVDQELARNLGASIVCNKPMSGSEMAKIMCQLEWPSLQAIPAPVSRTRSVARG
jgi:CheY-like chemotaxis protein